MLALLLALLFLPFNAVLLDIQLADDATYRLAATDPLRWLISGLTTIPSALIAGVIVGRLVTVDWSAAKAGVSFVLIAWPLFAAGAMIAPALFHANGFPAVNLFQYCLSSCSALVEPVTGSTTITSEGIASYFELITTGWFLALGSTITLGLLAFMWGQQTVGQLTRRR